MLKSTKVHFRCRRSTLQGNGGWGGEGGSETSSFHGGGGGDE